MGRNAREILADRILLLWLLYDAMHYKRFGDTKAQKLTYLSEKKMIDNREKGFNYDFVKLPYGPYSEQLQKDILWIEEQRLIDSIPVEDGKVFHESRFGRKLLSDFHELFARNNLFTREIAEVNRTYAIKNSQEIVDYVHSLPHPYIKNRTIEDLKLGTKILYKLDERKAEKVFDLSPEELATLDIYLDDESYRSVMEASESAKKKPLLSFDEVF
jgi:uncharacterized protein YwgA